MDWVDPFMKPILSKVEGFIRPSRVGVALDTPTSYTITVIIV
jgi:hypothetical protein